MAPSSDVLKAPSMTPAAQSMSMSDYQVQYSFPKKKIKVLLLENIHDTAVNSFKSEEFQVERLPKALSEDELIARISDVHILGIRSKTRVTSKALGAAKRLLAIGCFCIGTDQVNLKAAGLHGVPVFNAPFSNTRSVAELVLAELISLARRLPIRNADMHAGRWQKSASGCYEVRGKVLGIVGFGHIGSQLSVLAEAVGMRVKYYDVQAVQRMGNAEPCQSLDDLLESSDFVSLHVPKSPTTKNMIGEREIKLMKEGSYLINASRGTVVVLDALADALRSGHLAGAAVDVFPVEPAKNGDGFESPLRELPNVILTPHIAGSTVEAQKGIGEEVARTLTNFVNEGTTSGAVNFPKIDIPKNKGVHRILNVHHNRPGALAAINGIIAESGANVHLQMLGTDENIGYLVLEIDKEAGEPTKSAIQALEHNITTRILY